jgi:hypothetical protein
VINPLKNGCENANMLALGSVGTFAKEKKLEAHLELAFFGKGFSVCSELYDGSWIRSLC